jgi:hypothetical protein
MSYLWRDVVPTTSASAGQPVQLGVDLTGPGLNQVPDAQLQQKLQQALANQTGLSTFTLN